MTSIFRNQVQVSIEDAWVNATENLTPYNAHAVWETLVSHTPTDQWRPDAVLGQAQNGRTRAQSLAELWFSKHTQSSSPVLWFGFLQRVAQAYPDLNTDAVLRATWQGLSSSYARASRYEHSGSEQVVQMWLKAFPAAWKSNQKEKNTLLVQAAELNLLNLGQDLITAGASAQVSLRFARSKEMYDLLVKAGASTFEPSEEDPREGDALKEEKRQIKCEKKATVYESLISRDDKAFVSAQDREKIVGDMTRQRLKQSKNKPSAFSDQERSAMLFSAIAEAKKFKEVLSAIKSCLPQAWEWTHKDKDGVEINVLMAVAHRADLTLLEEALGDRIPADTWAKKDSKGHTLLDHVMEESSDGVTPPLSLAALKKTLGDQTPTAEQAIRSLVHATNKWGRNQAVQCPVRRPVPAEEGVERVNNVWGLTKSDFWSAVDRYEKTSGSLWVKDLVRVLVSETPYGGTDENANENWRRLLLEERVQKGGFTRGADWATVGLVTDLNQARKSAHRWNKSEAENATALKLAAEAFERWAPLGADLELALPKSNAMRTDVFSEKRQSLIAAAERAMLTEKTKKALKKTTQPEQGFAL